MQTFLLRDRLENNGSGLYCINPKKRASSAGAKCGRGQQGKTDIFYIPDIDFGVKHADYPAGGPLPPHL